jgi:hypothetical protein
MESGVLQGTWVTLLWRARTVPRAHTPQKLQRRQKIRDSCSFGGDWSCSGGVWRRSGGCSLGLRRGKGAGWVGRPFSRPGLVAGTANGSPLPLLDLGGASRWTAGLSPSAARGRERATLTGPSPAPPSSRSKGGRAPWPVRIRLPRREGCPWGVRLAMGSPALRIASYAGISG